MATALALRSRVTRKCQARFWSGGGVGDRPADHNLAGLVTTGALANLYLFLGYSYAI